jgi:hypothetical protein
VVATSTGPLARLGFAVALRDGEHVERDDVLVVRGPAVTVTGEPFPLNADGELHGPVDAATWTVRPAPGRCVRVPPAATSSGGSADGRLQRSLRRRPVAPRVRSISTLREKSSSRWLSRVAVRSPSSAISTTSSSWSSERRLKFDEPTTAAMPSTVMTFACIIDGWKVQTVTPHPTRRS